MIKSTASDARTKLLSLFVTGGFTKLRKWAESFTHSFSKHEKIKKHTETHIYGGYHKYFYDPDLCCYSQCWIGDFVLLWFFVLCGIFLGLSFWLDTDIPFHHTLDAQSVKWQVFVVSAINTDDSHCCEQCTDKLHPLGLPMSWLLRHVFVLYLYLLKAEADRSYFL